MNSLLAGSLLIGGAVAETVHGVVVFTRHGDRTTKHYGAQALTTLGASQNFQVGTSYRERYLDPESDHQILGISPNEYIKSQIYATAPNQGILSNTATAFLQGLYPPLSETDPDLATNTLNNGSDSTAPLDGYQYVLLNGVGDESENSIWIKGDDSCPEYTAASKTFTESDVFAQRVEDTKEFYSQFYKYLDDVYDLVPENMTYKNAYTIFDLINVARIHNESSNAVDVTEEQLFQLRTLADSQEFGLNYNASQPARSVHARTLSGGVLRQLNETVSSKGKLKFSLISGSYDTFLAFFGVTGLADKSADFQGLPGYASTMAFELFTEDDVEEFPAEEDLRIRWMLKNGTEGDLTAFPLFGQDEEVLSYSKFLEEMDSIAIRDVGTWCDVCSATIEFCAAYEDETDTSEESENESESESGSKGGMCNAVAGVIGAMVTLGVVAIVGAAAFIAMRRQKRSLPAVVATRHDVEKRSVGSVSESASGDDA